MTTYSLECEILSPLHIGCNKELTPLDYLPRQEGFLFHSMDRLMARLDDVERTKLINAINQNNLISLRKHVARLVEEQDILYTVAAAPEAEQNCMKNQDNPANQLLLQPFIRTGNRMRPYIPGSSVKGALRTGIINLFAQQRQPDRPQSFMELMEFEKKVMQYQNPQSDPFRMLKVRDAHLQNTDMRIHMVYNMSRKHGPLQRVGLEMLIETTESSLTRSEGPTFAVQTLLDPQNLAKTKYFSTHFDAALIATACRDFYLDKLRMEHDKFYKGGDCEEHSRRLLEAAEATDAKDLSFIFRMGRFSQVESVTVDTYRNPQPPRGRGWGNTRNLAAALYPMGWVRARFVAQS